jgi:hypothetical protein
MKSDGTSPDAAYRAVLLAAGLLLFGLLFRQLVTLMLAGSCSYIAVPPPARRASPRPRSSRSGQFRDRYYRAGEHEDHDQELQDDPVARHVHVSDDSRTGPAGYSMIAWRRAMATACTRVSASSLRMARFVSDLTVSVLSPMRPATSSV